MTHPKSIVSIHTILIYILINIHYLCYFSFIHQIQSAFFGIISDFSYNFGTIRQCTFFRNKSVRFNASAFFIGIIFKIQEKRTVCTKYRIGLIQYKTFVCTLFFKCSRLRIFLKCFSIINTIVSFITNNISFIIGNFF